PVVGALDVLVHGGPEVVGKLGALHHHADLLGVAAEAVGRAYNEVLGDRRVEHARLAELGLEALGDQEDAFLFLVRDVLAPQEGVRVFPELGAQAGVDALAQCQAAVFGVLEVADQVGPTQVGNAVAARLVGRGEHELQRRGRVGLLRALAVFVGVAEFLVGGGFHGRELLFRKRAAFEQPLAEDGQRVAGAGLLELLLVAVQAVVVAVAVAADAHALGVHDGHALARAGVFGGLVHGLEAGDHVTAVNVPDAGAVEAPEVVGGPFVGGLVAL